MNEDGVVPARRMRKTLVVGWFSFPGMGATAGDLMARDLCSRWLSEAGIEHDVAQAEPFTGGVDCWLVEPSHYDQVVFVCGPFGNGPPITRFLERFAGRRMVGLDVSMLQDLADWDPFDALIERDSSRMSRPDISILAADVTVPLVGVILVHRQQEYSDSRHGDADAAIERLVASRDVAPVRIDTRLDVNAGGLTSARQVESLIARMDAVVTTRLHGMVLAIKHGVPPVVIDPVAGGRKVLRQARTIGWEDVFVADSLDDVALGRALDRCLSVEGRGRAHQVRDRALHLADGIRLEFLEAIRPMTTDTGS